MLIYILYITQYKILIFHPALYTLDIFKHKYLNFLKNTFRKFPKYFNKNVFQYL